VGPPWRKWPIFSQADSCLLQGIGHPTRADPRVRPYGKITSFYAIYRPITWGNSVILSGAKDLLSRPRSL